jgi:hypothetical protein
MSIEVFWLLTPCGLVGAYQRSGGTCRLHVWGEMELSSYPEDGGGTFPQNIGKYPHGVKTRITTIREITLVF